MWAMVYYIYVCAADDDSRLDELGSAEESPNVGTINETESTRESTGKTRGPYADLERANRQKNCG